jgi:Tol biopolymer transport system component
MLSMSLNNGVWSKPAVMPFSGRYKDADPTISYDGGTLFFISARPLPGADISENDWNIWEVKRTDTGWGEPEPISDSVNSSATEIHPSVAADGSLYFSSSREGGFGGGDIYRSEYKNGRYLSPVNLGERINTKYGEGDIFIAPDESYIIFSSGRPGGYGDGDLYISYRFKDGTWSKSINMGGKINSAFMEYCPGVSPEGKYLFFTSYRKPNIDYRSKPLTYEKIKRIYRNHKNGFGDIYWVSAEVIENLKDM